MLGSPIAKGILGGIASAGLINILEIKTLRQEKEILRKAAAFFAREEIGGR